MNEKRQAREEVADSTGGLWGKLLEWTGWSDAIGQERNRIQALGSINAQKEYLNKPYSEKMEEMFGKGGRFGNNLDASEVKDANSLRWFIYNLDGNNKAEVKILQDKLNVFFDEHGWDIEDIKTDGNFGNRTISRMKYFIDTYDKHYNTDLDSKEALMKAEELIFYRNNDFTTESDTMRIKEDLEGLNPSDETTDLLEQLKIIPK